MPLDLALLATIDPSGSWNKLDGKTADPVRHLQAQWWQSVQGKKWQQVAFFLQEAQEKALIQAGVIGIVRAVSLSEAGARAEALVELEDARSDLKSEDARKKLSQILSIYHSLSLDHGRAKALSEGEAGPAS